MSQPPTTFHGLPCPSCGDRQTIRIGPCMYRCNGCMFDFVLADIMPRLMDESNIHTGKDAPTIAPIDGQPDTTPRLTLIEMEGKK